MIRFGSRTEVYLPMSAEIVCKVGDRVQSGVTIIARLRPQKSMQKSKVTSHENAGLHSPPQPGSLRSEDLPAAEPDDGGQPVLRVCGDAQDHHRHAGANPRAGRHGARAHETVWSKLAIDQFHAAIWFILGACVFDVLDGRLARLGGQDSPFGREFDSLADTVSFGLAPALLVYKIVLDEFGQIGMIIAFIYLACGTLRLARFNCISASSDADKGAQTPSDAGKNFKGFPIPAAAGVIASLTELLLWFDETSRNRLGAWKFVLPPLLLFLSYMMFSHFKYPSFKALNWRTQRTLPALLVIIVLILLTWQYYQWMPAVIFPDLPDVRVFTAVALASVAAEHRAGNRRGGRGRRG